MCALLRNIIGILVAVTAILVVLQALSSPLLAQSRSTSAVRGTIVGEDGSPVSEVALRLTHRETGAVRTALTDEEGAFLFLLVAPGGPYDLTGTRLGFEDVTRRGITLAVGQTEVIDIVLSDRPIALEGIEVEVDRTVAAVFDPDRVGPSLVLDERRIESTPLISRNLIELTQLSPLVRSTSGGGYSIGGQNDRYNAVLIDGVLNQDLFGLTAGGVPGAQAGARLLPLDAVAQYEVLIAPFDVRLTGFTGGVLNAVTRSGTNTFQGRATAAIRTEGMIGDLDLPTGSVEASGVERRIVGLSVGGPLVRDRAHFFVSGEFEHRSQPPDGFNLTRDPPSLIRIDPLVADRAAEVIEEQYGLDAGLGRPFPLVRRVANLFGRLDFVPAPEHRLTLRNVFAFGENDESPNRSIFGAYGFSTNGIGRRSLSNTTSLQIFSDLPFGGNELTLSVRHSQDETHPRTEDPQVEVDLFSTVDNVSVLRPVRFGGEYFAQENDLTQTSASIANSLTLSRGGGSTTVGVTGTWHRVSQRYLPAASGHWYFASLDNLLENRPFRYEQGVLGEGEATRVKFDIVDWGAYAQHQIAVVDGLTMRFGLRLEMPHVLSRPRQDANILDWFGFDTSDVPSGMLMVSPRWGFNWQDTGERRWQIRGGAGLFTGTLPYVWLANAFHNNGLRTNTRVCVGRIDVEPAEGSTAPPFIPGQEPESCVWPRQVPPSAFENARTVTVFANGFTFPQELKFTFAADRELTQRLTASFSALFGTAINQIVLSEENLGDPTGLGEDLAAFGALSGRRFFGSPSREGFDPNRLLPGYEQVLVARNETQDWSFALSAEMRGRLSDRISVQGGYSYARSYDHMSLVSTDMVANFGFTPAASDPNDPRLRPSNFDRPHKVVAAVYGAPFPNLPRTEVSLLYTGQSGTPFSYVYDGDLNGDGFPGVGPAFDRFNDPIYVPTRSSELPMGIASVALLEDALQRDACLAKHRGRILPRNACRGPWQHQLDVRLTHGFDAFGASVRLDADLINVLNLINGAWGRIESIQPVVPLIAIERGPRDLGGWPPLSARWAGGVLPRRDEAGTLRASQPWTVETPDSQWQIQIGFHATFGRSR